MRPKLFVLVLALGFLSACAPLEVYTADKAPEYVTRVTTSFYKNGPAQPGQPDEIRAETFIHLLSKGSDGYSVVKLPDGRSGYMVTKDIRVAPPTAVAVTEEKLFPERQYVEVPLPEPDFSLPVEEIVPGTKDKTPKKSQP